MKKLVDYIRSEPMEISKWAATLLVVIAVVVILGKLLSLTVGSP